MELNSIGEVMIHEIGIRMANAKPLAKVLLFAEICKYFVLYCVIFICFERVSLLVE